jgi:hypothetical protein
MQEKPSTIAINIKVLTFGTVIRLSTPNHHNLIKHHGDHFLVWTSKLYESNFMTKTKTTTI